VLLMMLPVLGLLAFGLWRQRHPPTPPAAKPKFGITAQITREPIHPVNVWAGCDTRLSIRFQPNGPLPAGWGVNSVEWLQCLRLVARKNGRDRMLFRLGDSTNWDSYRRWLPSRNGTSGGGCSGNGGQSSLGLALRKVPREWGELWLLLDVGLRPAASIDSHDIDAATVARLKAQGGAVWTSKSLRLRRDGEALKMPVVSTNPQLELRDWHIEPYQSGPGDSPEDRQLIMHLFDSGPLPQKQSEWYHMRAGSDWQIVDEKGQPRGTMTGDPAPASVTLVKGKRSYVAKFSFSSRIAPEARRLRLRGQLSCHNRWPLMLDIPLFDRTKQTSKAPPRSR